MWFYATEDSSFMVPVMGTEARLTCHKVCYTSPVDRFCFDLQENCMAGMAHCMATNEPQEFERQQSSQDMAIAQAMVVSVYCRTSLTCESRYIIPLKYR
jgi:hypothetical protein